MNAIVFEQVTKAIPSGFLGRPRRILDNVDVAVGAGEIHGLVGHNGAGKSTALRLLTGCSRPTQGAVSLFGQPPIDWRARRRLGFAPDIAALPQNLIAAELVAFVAKARRLEGVDVGAAVGRVGLEIRREPVAAYSKGMQQRLSLALAILGDPDVWVLDEPMSGIDPQGRELVRKLISEHRVRGGTVVFSSHSLADVDALCEKLTVLEKGRVVFSGAAREFIGIAEFEIEFIGEIVEAGARRGVHGTVIAARADELPALLARHPSARIHSVFPKIPDLAVRLAALK